MKENIRYTKNDELKRLRSKNEDLRCKCQEMVEALWTLVKRRKNGNIVVIRRSEIEKIPDEAAISFDRTKNDNDLVIKAV